MNIETQLKKLNTWLLNKYNCYFLKAQNHIALCINEVRRIELIYHFFSFSNGLELTLTASDESEEALQISIGFPLLFKFLLTFKFVQFKWLRKLINLNAKFQGNSRRTGFSISIPFIESNGQLIQFGLWKADNHELGNWNGWGFIKTWEEVIKGPFTVHDEEDTEIIHLKGVVKQCANLQPNTLVEFEVEIIPRTVTYKRKYVKSQSFNVYTVKPLIEIKVPGKGENDFDMEDEVMGVMFLNGPKNEEEAIQEYLNSIYSRMGNEKCQTK